MLLEFRVENYRSFKDELIFSMTPNKMQKDLAFSIQKEQIGNKEYSALSSAVIYGPNASGKTNIITAMDTFRTILLRGNIKNADSMTHVNPAANNLELIPFCEDEVPCPVSFAIKFTNKDVLIDYSLQMDLGIFLDKDYERSIINETLSINGVMIFERKNNSLKINVNSINDFLNASVEQNLESADIISQNGLNSTDLFLTNGFKSIFSTKIVALIHDWIENKFMVICRANSMQVVWKFVDPKDGTIYVEKTLSEAAKEFGINSNELGFKPVNEGLESVLFSIFKKNLAIPAELFESYGTIRFVNEFPLIIRALITGSILVMDEFDASIHPMALMNIINIFHNDEINIRHAQLVFNTHNPIFLNGNLFRRDEIKFVEKDEVTHKSTQYSLADFKTFGSNGVRKSDDYMKHYFVNRYGAIKEVDFVPIIESIMKNMGAQNDEQKKNN